MSIVWHYTRSGDDIIRDGKIKARKHGMTPEEFKATACGRNFERNEYYDDFPNEKAAVWFSSDPVLEATVKPYSVSYRRLLTTDECGNLTTGFWRFAVDRKFTITYSAFIAAKGFGSDDALASRWIAWINRKGKEMGGSKYDWFLCLEDVPADKWQNVEILKSGKWQPREVKPSMESLIEAEYARMDKTLAV